jgi:hypothetical protein
VKPNSIRKFLTSLEVPGEDELCRRIDAVEEHLIERNAEQFSHAGQTLFGYTDLGNELGHTGDSPMDDDINDDILEYDALINTAIQEIVEKLKKHIIKPIVMPEDFKSVFKCVPEYWFITVWVWFPSL